MKKIVKYIIGGLVIFGAGFGTGWVVCSKMKEQEEKYLGDLDNDDSEETPKYYVREHGGVEDLEGYQDERDIEEISDEEHNDYLLDMVRRSYIDEAKQKGTIVNFKQKPEILEIRNNIINGLIEQGIKVPTEKEVLEEVGLLEEENINEYEELSDEELAEMQAEEKEWAKEHGEPYLISYSEMLEVPDDYERVSLYFYMKDMVLCEDGDAIVDSPDIPKTCGLDFMETFYNQTTAWVRNDTLYNLYEIHRIDGSYEKEVLGVSETPTERELRIIARRKRGRDN